MSSVFIQIICVIQYKLLLTLYGNINSFIFSMFELNKKI
jgi:hypothetical protein